MNPPYKVQTIEIKAAGKDMNQGLYIENDGIIIYNYRHSYPLVCNGKKENKRCEVQDKFESPIETPINDYESLFI